MSFLVVFFVSNLKGRCRNVVVVVLVVSECFASLGGIEFCGIQEGGRWGQSITFKLTFDFRFRYIIIMMAKVWVCTVLILVAVDHLL